jgi:diacylglycerol O-acyltransferase
MSDVDASFLYFETPANHMHIVATLLVDASAFPGWGAQDVVQLLEQRMHLLPALRQRIAPAMLRLHHPVWVDVHSLDVARHVSRVTCPSPGTTAELARKIADFASRQLDRSRPLWECLVVEGMADGRAAIVLKIHHCAVDGVGLTRLLAALLDLEADGGPPSGPAAIRSRPDRAPSLMGIAAHTASGLTRRSWKQVRTGVTATTAMTRLLNRPFEALQDERARRPAAPRAPFNGAITPGRAVAFVDVALEDVKAIKAAVDGTFNDAITAITGGALRGYLLERGELPRASLIAAVPVSTRGDQSDTAANRTFARFVSLGTDVADPLERLTVAHESNQRAKREQREGGASLIARASGVVPPATNEALARFYSAARFANFHPVVHNLVLSNVAGPSFQVCVAGVPVEAILPLGPVMEGPGLNITLASYRDRVGVGIIACRSRMPDIDLLAAQFPVSVKALIDAVQPHGT